MTPEEKSMLDEALGRANAAMNLVTMLIQMMAETKVVPFDHMLEALDVTACVAEDCLGDPRSTPDVAVQVRELKSAVAELANLQRPATRAT